MTPTTVAINLGVASLAGLAIGLEREWSGHATGPNARFAGIRTFFLIGLGGGIGGWLLVEGYPTAMAVLVGALAALAIVAYALVVRNAPAAIDGTTEAAALVTLSLGVVAGLGHILIAAGGTAVVALALGEKSEVQRFVRLIGVDEMKAALQFAVLALVVLPLLPPGPYGPFDIFRPRTLWTFVLLFSAINFIGYLAKRAIGERGYIVTGALGGLVSSTAIALTFARASRREPAAAAALAAGTVAASTVLFVRALAVVGAVAPPVALALLPFLAAPFLAGLAVVAFEVLRAPPAPAAPAANDGNPNPLGLGIALQLAAILQVVIILVVVARSAFGNAGVLATAATIGLVEPDGVVLSVAGTAVDARPAAVAIAVALLANTLFKLALATGIGAPALRLRAGAGLGAIALALAGALAFIR